MNRRNIFLRVILLLAALLPAPGCSAQKSPIVADVVQTTIGPFAKTARPENAAAEDALVQEMARQIRRSPHAASYTVHYEVTKNGKRTDDVRLTYERKSGLLAVKPDYSAEIRLWNKVTDQKIETLAKKRAPLKQLNKLGCAQLRQAYWEQAHP